MAYDLDGFVRFCSKLRIAGGGKMELYPEQLDMLRDYFAGTQETLIIVPKKNGKTTLLAALALYHLRCTPDAECFIVASSRDQGMVLYRFARALLRRSGQKKSGKDVRVDGHNFRVLYGTREIQNADDDGFLRVMAADENTADGVTPTLVLVDELHRHRTSELYAVLRDGLGPRDGRMLTISTAGDSEDSPLGELRRRAHAIPGLVKGEAKRYVNHDGFCLHEWALDDGAEIDNMEVVKLANPAPWHTIETLRARYERPSTRIWEWKRFACGIWAFGEDSAIGEKEWRDCADPDTRIPDGAKGVYIGIDIGRRQDCTAIIALWREDEDSAARVEVIDLIKPPGDGTATPEDDIWEPLAACAERWPEATFVADPKLGGDIFMERMDNAFPTATFATFDQIPSLLVRMAQQVSDAIAAGRLRHPDNGELNRHVLAAVVKPVGEGWRFTKQRKRPKAWIDGLIALAMAYSTMVGAEPPPAKPAYFL